VAWQPKSNGVSWHAGGETNTISKSAVFVNQKDLSTAFFAAAAATELLTQKRRRRHGGQKQRFEKVSPTNCEVMRTFFPPASQPPGHGLLLFNAVTC
jgi:hypothetical protein